MEDEIYTELERIPPSYKVVEHHVGVYASNGNGSRIMRGKAPSRLLNHSILTPSLAASILRQSISMQYLLTGYRKGMVMMDLTYPVRSWLDG